MALKTVSLDGQDKVLKNLAKEIGKIKKGAVKGLARALIVVAAAAAPLTPVDKGFLRASQFKRIIPQGDTFIGTIGYTVKYAFFVHENLEVAHPIGQAKFLSEALRIKQQRIIAEIKGEIEIK